MENKENNQAALQMRKVGIKMNFLMGVSLSFFLSLIGMASSGHFEVKGWILSFVVSCILSLLIGFCLPVRKAGLAICRKCGLKERTLPFSLLESLISDIFYTPILTFSMVGLAYLGIKRQFAAAIANGASAENLPQITFAQIFVPSLVITMIAGFFLILIFQPIFLRILMKNMPKPAPERR